MKNSILTFFFFISILNSFSQIEGKWSGILEIQGTQLTLVFNITKENDGYKSTLDSPDQGATGIPIEETTFLYDTLTISSPPMQLSYTGVYNQLEKKIVGVFKQAGMEFPLDLSAGELKKERSDRPQTPKAPFTYYSEDVKFKNPKSGNILAGTITMPDTLKNYPVVILISGSGPQNRDEEILGHKPFLVLADHLTKNGFAVLRYDDRGVGESTGDFSNSTSADFATDVIAAIAFLKKHRGIDSKKIGLIGHSEGGMIAPIVASKSKDVAFIVLLAGPGIPITELMSIQTQKVAKAEGARNDLIETNLKVFNAISKLINDNQKLTNAQLAELLKKEMTIMFDTLPAEMKPPGEDQVKKLIEGQSAQVSSNWYRYFIAYNPDVYLKKVKCPVLAVNGSLDVQVSSKENLAGIQKSLENGKCKQFKIQEIEGLNHLFQETTSGAVSEYSTIEQTLSDKLFLTLDSWMEKCKPIF